LSPNGHKISDFFFPPPKSEYLFSATLGRIVFFLEKKHSLYGGRMQISKMGLILPYETYGNYVIFQKHFTLS
jgi:hypothetical protein